MWRMLTSENQILETSEYAKKYAVLCFDRDTQI